MWSLLSSPYAIRFSSIFVNATIKHIKFNWDRSPSTPRWRHWMQCNWVERQDVRWWRCAHGSARQKNDYPSDKSQPGFNKISFLLFHFNCARVFIHTSSFQCHRHSFVCVQRWLCESFSILYFVWWIPKRPPVDHMLNSVFIIHDYHLWSSSSSFCNWNQIAVHGRTTKQRDYFSNAMRIAQRQLSLFWFIIALNLLCHWCACAQALALAHTEFYTTKNETMSNMHAYTETANERDGEGERERMIKKRRKVNDWKFESVRDEISRPMSHKNYRFFSFLVWQVIPAFDASCVNITHPHTTHILELLSLLPWFPSPSPLLRLKRN